MQEDTSLSPGDAPTQKKAGDGYFEMRDTRARLLYSRLNFFAARRFSRRPHIRRSSPGS